MEQKNNTPEWVEAARKWQDENNEARSIFIIASDKDGSIVVVDGYGLVVVNSISQALNQDPKAARFIKDAQSVAKGGIAGHLFQEKFEAYAKEHGIEVKEINPLESLHDLLGSILGKEDE